MVDLRWSLLVIGCASACGGASHHQPSRSSTASFTRGQYEIEFTSARLAARRPDGRAWHTKPADNSAAVFGGLVGLAIGYPSVGLAIGEAASDSGGDPLAPAPYIDLKIESATFRVSPVGTTYAPNWRQPIAVDARNSDGAQRVVIQVRDALDDSVIAQHETTLAMLLGRPAQTFTNLGSVMSLDVVVKQAAPRKPTTYDLTVPSTVTLDALVHNGGNGWSAVPVWNGDRVSIAAVGQVCPTSGECFDAEGAEAGRWTSYCYDEFKDARHASLVGIAPGQRLVIGKARSFTVSESGVLLLFVNDSDVANNSGAFAAKVTVTPP